MTRRHASRENEFVIWTGISLVIDASTVGSVPLLDAIIDSWNRTSRFQEGLEYGVEDRGVASRAGPLSEGKMTSGEAFERFR